MADNNCGCAGSSSSPPGAQGTGASQSVASAFGGNIAVRRGPCGPARCPSPPLSEAEERTPYCVSWVEALTTAAAGKLLIAIEGCLFLLKSKCTGVVWFDADSEQVSIRFPDFVSSLPKENAYGFLAKVVPTTRKVCVDGQESCDEEVHQELAAQIMGQSNCGNLMIARAPLCGELPATTPGRTDDQVHIDHLNPALHEDVGCPVDVRFLASYDGDRGDAARTPCKKWSLMRRIKMRLSQWGFIEKGNALESLARRLVVVPVAGGDEEDPCYEVRVLESLTGGIPSGAANCDVLVWKNHGTPEAGWMAQSEMLGPLWLATAHPLAFGANTNLPRYDELKAKGCKLSAIVQFSLVVSGTSGQGGTLVYFAGGFNLGAISMTAGSSDADAGQSMCKLTTNSLPITRSGAMTGTVTHSFSLLGYFIG